MKRGNSKLGQERTLLFLPPCSLGSTQNHNPPLPYNCLLPQTVKSNGSVAGRPGFEPLICGVFVQCLSGMLRCRHCGNRFPYHPLPTPFQPRVSIYRLKTEGRAGPIASVEGKPGPQPMSTVGCLPHVFQVCSLPFDL